jgi:hypothetical protein
VSARAAVIVVVIAACRPAPPAGVPSTRDGDAQARALCAGAAARVTLERLPPLDDLPRFRASPHGEYDATEAVQLWEADLNGDGIIDRAVSYEGTCGNYGECVVGVYVGCGGDELVVVRGPDYEYGLDVGATETVVDGVPWRDLTVVERTERAVRPPYRAVFDGARYR